MRRLRCALLLSVLLMSAAWGDTVLPLVAQTTNRTYELLSNGQRKLVDEQRGILLRKADGSELRKFRVYQNGVPVGRELGTMQDFVLHRTIRLDYTNKRVFNEGEIPKDFEIRLSRKMKPPPERVTGEEIVAGIRCKKIVGPNHQLSHNVAFVSFDYDLLVKTEHISIAPNGTRYWFESELSDIKIGTEPDPNEFSIPATFEKFEKTNNASCKSCPTQGGRQAVK